MFCVSAPIRAQMNLMVSGSICMAVAGLTANSSFKSTSKNASAKLIAKYADRRSSRSGRKLKM